MRCATNVVWQTSFQALLYPLNFTITVSWPIPSSIAHRDGAGRSIWFRACVNLARHECGSKMFKILQLLNDMLMLSQDTTVGSQWIYHDISVIHILILHADLIVWLTGLGMLQVFPTWFIHKSYFKEPAISLWSVVSVSHVSLAVTASIIGISMYLLCMPTIRQRHSAPFDATSLIVPNM